MIKKITLIGCEFCHKPYSNTAAADAGFMCDDCVEGRAERKFKDRLSKHEADFRSSQKAIEQEYSDWQAKNS